MILAVFNDIICLQEYPPADWKSARLSVIFKKGDSALPDNYRPISILSILYKLFSRMFCKRLSSILMPLQAVDQAAYRKTFSTDDHTFVVTQLVEKAQEFNLPIWFVLIDYSKAFDSVEHTMLWKVLKDQRVLCNACILEHKRTCEPMFLRDLFVFVAVSGKGIQSLRCYSLQLWSTSSHV